MATTPTSKRRSYDDGCAAAHALDLVGERWALLVVRELLLGPKRFTDLRAGLPNASPNVLAQRLRELEGAGVVRRRKLPPPAASRVYELTDWGMELEPVITRLGRWGARSPSKPRDAALGIDSLILSLRTMFDPRAADGLRATYELHLGEDRFRAVVADGRFEIARGGAQRPEDRGRRGGGGALPYPLPSTRAGRARRRGVAPLCRQRASGNACRRTSEALRYETPRNT